MKKRAKMYKSKDVGVFKKTFNKTKRINRSSTAQPGGTRL